MNFKLYLSSFLCLLSINILFSQQQENIDNHYKEYFSSQREVPYLHLNKTSFIEGEEIWFKSYVYNLNLKKLHNNTSNLHITLYDKKGNLKDQKLLHIENGVGAGSFKIDSTFTDNEYYIKASTNWMKNFKEDESYLQKFTIIKKEPKVEKSLDPKYDIQFLPESGHLLEAIENTIGVAIKDVKNNGVKIKEGKVFDNEKNLTNIFKTNSLGIGSFDFIHEEGKNYTAEITLMDDTKIIKEIPLAEKRGVILSVYNPNTTFVSIFIKTNTNSLPDLVNKEYTLFIHNTSKTIKQVFTFNKETTEYNINLNSRKIDSGINIVTIFDENNKPIAERLFFNYKKDIFKKSLITANKHIDSDSTSITISKNSSNSDTYYLSASILPEKAKNYRPDNNIASKFLIKPFINGEIENPEYYFKDINRKKLMNLDLLLLTQGWSKYSWSNVFKSAPKEIFENEKGISIKGNITSSKEANTIFLFSKENNLMETAPIINNKFKFSGLYIKENSKISLSTKQGKKIKQDKFYAQYFPVKINDKINPSNINTSNNKILDSNIDYGKFIGDGLVELDEITIKSKEKKSKNKFMIVGPSRSYKIDENSVQSLNIFTFIRQKGFRVNESNGNYTIYSGRGTISLTATKPTQVYFNGSLIQDDTGYNALQELDMLTLKDFEEIVVSKTGFGEIHLYSSPGFYKSRSKNRFSEKTIPLGYATEKEYYQPQYANYYGDFYQENGVINWKSNIIIDNKAKDTSFNILNLGQKYIRVHLEGISAEGKIILEDKIIELK